MKAFRRCSKCPRELVNLRPRRPPPRGFPKASLRSPLETGLSLQEYQIRYSRYRLPQPKPERPALEPLDIGGGDVGGTAEEVPNLIVNGEEALGLAGRFEALHDALASPRAVSTGDALRDCSSPCAVDGPRQA